MKYVEMKKIIILFCLISSVVSYGQNVFSHAISVLPHFEIPVNNQSKRFVARGVRVPDNVGNGLTKLYTNYQCTEYFLAEDLGPHGLYCIDYKDSPYILVLLDFGSYTDFHTYNLYISDSDGKYYDSLEVKVWSNASIKDFIVDDKGNVIVSQIIPTSDTSIPIKVHDVFEAYRMDSIYRISGDGKFVKMEEIKYKRKLYMQDELIGGDHPYSIWGGGESVIDNL